MSRSPVKRGAPWKAKACAPTMTYSTLRALNNAQNSSKSGARSNELPPKELDGHHPLAGRAAAPVPRPGGLVRAPTDVHQGVSAVHRDNLNGGGNSVAATATGCVS